jgi:hypothetical protein
MHSSPNRLSAKHSARTENAISVRYAQISPSFGSKASLLSRYQTSCYPKVYLSANLKDEIEKARAIRTLLGSPVKRTKVKRPTSSTINLHKRPKERIPVASFSNIMTRISLQRGCACCRTANDSHEEGVKEIDRNTKYKAEDHFRNYFKRAKSSNRTGRPTTANSNFDVQTLCNFSSFNESSGKINGKGDYKSTKLKVFGYACQSNRKLI